MKCLLIHIKKKWACIKSYNVFYKIIRIIPNCTYAIILLSIFIWGGFKWRSSLARDYYQFWVVGQAIKVMDLNNIYNEEERYKIGNYFFAQAVKNSSSPHQIKAAYIRQVIVPAGSPFLYCIFSLISIGKYDLDYEIFRLVSLASFAFSIILFSYILKLPRIYTIVASLALTQFFDPFHSDVSEGNVNQLQLGIISLILYLRINESKKSYNFIAGLLSGLLVMFKPNLFPVFIFLIIRNFILSKRTALIYYMTGITIGFTLGFTFPFAILGKACTWHQWLIYFPKIALREAYMKKSFLYTFFGAKRLVYYYLFMLVLIFVSLIPLIMPKLIMNFTTRKFLNVDTQIFKAKNAYFILDSLMIILGSAVYILSSPLVHLHYFILIVPALLLILSFGKKFNLPLSKEALIPPFFVTILFLMFNVRIYHEGYEGIGIYRTYWPFAYISVIIIYGYALIKTARIFNLNFDIFRKLKEDQV